MSLLNRVANQEVFDFLRTVTIKCTYFADKFRETHILPSVQQFVPETVNPYTLHLAGEYILDPTDKANYPDLESYKRQLTKHGGTWYRKSMDLAFSLNKNYFVKRDAVFHRLSKDTVLDYIEEDISPVDLELYEYQPFVVDGIINPIDGSTRSIEIACSNQVYDRDGSVYPELRNTELFTPQAFNRMMYVTSLDTGQLIPFTLENLYEDCALAAGLPETSVHVKTLEAYKIPGRYFDLLCERYPTQVDLIKAIVYRVPSQKIPSLITPEEIKSIIEGLRKEGKTSEAFLNDLKYRFKTDQDLIRLFGQDLDGFINPDDVPLRERRRTRIAKAKNFELLHVDTSRLDITERDDLIAHTTKILDIVAKRWAIDGFNFESNYAAVLWSMVWSILPTALIARRYANIKTPAVSLNHMWDYLGSHGLSEYRGYLSDTQVQFLYKNILYLKDHAGQQRTLNILIDNILGEYGLNLKTKTVVLDTSKSLSIDQTPTLSENQCLTCSKRNVTCFKNIKTHICDDWLGTTHLCKADPIILTEEFTGATKQQIVKGLMKNFGYTADAAEFKYRRSFIWKDADVEAIKDDLNRHQIVDQNGKVSSLEELISVEHRSGIEPIYNDDIVAEQEKELRHMNGTHVPTKLLEMSRSFFNARFADMFNRFVTESMFRLAPRINDEGKIINKVTFSYKFDTTEGASEYIFSFGEMLAAAYLAFVRENKIDTLIDEIAVESKESRKPIYEIVIDESTGKPVVIGEDEIGKPIYLKRLQKWVQHRLTDMMNSSSYDFAIPSKCRTTTTLKFCRPIIQQKLVDTWRKSGPSSEYELINLVDNIPSGNDTLKILEIDGSKYAVVEVPTLEDEDWETFDTKLVILGSFTTVRSGKGVEYTYHHNDDEIPLIPKYFKWYHRHLNPSEDVSPEAKKQMEHNLSVVKKPQDGEYVEAPAHASSTDDLNGGFRTPSSSLSVQSDVKFIDPSKSEIFDRYEIEDYVDLESLFSRWVNVTGLVTNQNTVASYIDNMFDILETLHCLASAASSIRAQMACKKVLECILSRKEIRFDLTGTARTHLVEDGTKVAYFSEWVGMSQELEASFRVLENLATKSSGWNELGTAITNQLLKGCTIPYASSIIDDNQFNKVKQLVRQLSSYKINIVDDNTSALTCVSTTQVAIDSTIDEMQTIDRVYFDAVGEGKLPHVGGLKSTDDSGFIMVPTTDLRRIADKEYFCVKTKNGSDVVKPDERSPLNPIDAPFTSEVEVSPNNSMKVGWEFSTIPTYEPWKPFDQTSDVYALDGKKYYRIVVETGEYGEISDLSTLSTVKKSEATDLPDNATVGLDKDGNEIVFIVADCYEAYDVGDRLPFGKLLERISLYDLLGIKPNTPLSIGKDDKGNWFYMTGTEVDDEIRYPASAADAEHPYVTTEQDKFDLKNDFSNAQAAQMFGSTVYRFNIPTKRTVWKDPVYSLKLEKALYPTVASVGILTESVEPSLLLLVKDSEGNEGTDLDPKDREYVNPPS